MSDTTPEAATPSLAPSDFVAAEVRVLLARKDWTQGRLAEEIRARRPNITAAPQWVSRRIGVARFIDLTLEDVALIAAALDVDPIELQAPRAALAS